MSKGNFVEQSKLNWVTANGAMPANEQLMLGCLQRIATAVEAMTQDRVSLVKQIEDYKERLENEVSLSSRLHRSNSSLRGAITKMKKAKAGK